MIGSPSKSEIAKIKRGDIRQVLLERPVIEPKDLSKVFAKAPAPAVQILGESLKFDPEKRSVVMALLGGANWQFVCMPHQHQTRFGQLACFKAFDQPVVQRCGGSKENGNVTCSVA